MDQEDRDANGSHIDYAGFASFKAQTKECKLFSHLQMRFLSDATGFKGTPTILRQETGIGRTKNPCGAIGGFAEEFDGQHVPNNGPPAIVSVSKRRVTLINDGSHDAGAIRAVID